MEGVKYTSGGIVDMSGHTMHQGGQEAVVNMEAMKAELRKIIGKGNGVKPYFKVKGNGQEFTKEEYKKASYEGWTYKQGKYRYNLYDACENPDKMQLDDMGLVKVTVEFCHDEEGHWGYGTHLRQRWEIDGTACINPKVGKSFNSKLGALMSAYLDIEKFINVAQMPESEKKKAKRAMYEQLFNKRQLSLFDEREYADFQCV